MDFCKAVIHQLAFASARYRYVGYCSRTGGAEWAHQEAEMSLEHKAYFFDDLKVYQESHEILRDVNEAIVQASYDTVACYGVPKCAEIVFERGKIVRGDRLQFVEEKVKTMDPVKMKFISSWG